MAINDGGDIVGKAAVAGQESHAALWHDGQVYDFNNLIAPIPGVVLTSAHGIAIDGKVAASALDFDESRAFLLTPACTEDSDCDDGDACNGPEVCVEGNCQPTITDCNANGIDDFCDLFDCGCPGGNQSDDCNGNWIPDECDGLMICTWESVATHGTVGEVGLVITEDGTYVEPRRSGISKIVVSFTTAIDAATAGPGSVSVVGCDAAGALDLTGISIATSVNSPANTQMEMVFTPKLPGSEPDPAAGPLAARYAITLTGIMSAGGSPLSGTASRDLRAVLGDVWTPPNGSGDVTSADVGFTQAYAQAGVDPIDPADIGHVRADVTGDGKITSADFGLVRSMAQQGRDGRDIDCN